MKLVAVTGLDRTEWMTIDGDEQTQASTDRLNPYLQTRKEISRLIRLGLPESYFRGKFENVYFYGEGCYTEDKITQVANSLTAQFKTKVKVSDIMLGVARGLFLNESGIACVLGRSSGSCLYNGTDVVRNIRSGGFAMGDEGGACYLGRHFLADFLKELTPQNLVDAFKEEFHMTEDDVVERVYHRSKPQDFFCEVAVFLSSQLNDEYVNQLVSFGFRVFFQRSPNRLDLHAHPVRFVGTIAVVYQDLLRKVAAEFGVEDSIIVESPIKGLATYHEING